MSTMQIKSLNTPEEVRTLPKTTVEVITFGELSLMKLTLQPGWRWSEHVKPVTLSCSHQGTMPGSLEMSPTLDWISRAAISTARRLIR